MKSSLILWTLSFLVIIPVFSQDEGTKLLRQPSIHQDLVVFVYANDLWLATIDQKDRPKRLTSNKGAESNPHFSPDGKWIAFTGQYEGNSDVYLLSIDGGEPHRLTYHPSADIVQGWTPDNEILFRSSREARPTQTNKFFIVSINGGLPQSLPIDRAAYGEISPDGKSLAYTPITSWDPEWRNYRGGQAMPVWIVDLNTLELIRTPQPTKERHLNPVWIGNDVYYLSERDYASNIWKFSPNTGQEKQITFHKKFDVKSLDSDANQIVYEQGGDLHVINIENGDYKKLVIQILGDMNFSRPRWESVPSQQLTNAKLSPKGKRALFEYRGEIFSVPKEEGSWRNLTNSSSSAERFPIWSPKGDRIAWFSDRSGEYTMVIGDQYGKELMNISIPNPTFYFRPAWSPDGNYIAFTDTHYNMIVLSINSQSTRVIDSDLYAHPNRTMNPVWSPDSKWIAYAKQQRNHFKAIYAYNMVSKSILQITDPLADAISPVWSDDGKFLYTLVSTNYGLNSGWLDMSSYDPEMTRNLYAISLSKDQTSPTLPKMDEEKIESKKEDKEDDDKKEESPAVIIDQDGLFDRAIPLDIEAGNYMGLLEGPEDTIFLFKREDDGISLVKYEIDSDKSSTYLTNVNTATTSFDRKNILYRSGFSWKIVSTKSVSSSSKSLTLGIQMKVDPRAEYHQIFKEGWRFKRDFLYIDNTHGAPWDTIYQWYSPWIDHVRHRTDLNYVIDILSGEVAVGHSYVSGGDMPNIDFVPVGLLGCDFMVDQDHYKISKIYKGERWNPGIQSPLGLLGIDVKEGDYLLSINGRELTASINPYQLLEQTANRTIYIEVSSSLDPKDIRKVIVKPVRSELALRTIDWIENNRRKVDELSQGKLAYVYVPNTSRNGFNSFNRYYFSQQDKKGVIIDERNNGGGSAADYMIDIMSREPIGYFNSKTSDRTPWTAPLAGIWGPKVMLINERAGSGGDLLPYMFKLKNLGPLVGTRTWGGLVGTWDTPSFIDGGRMVAPRGGFFNLDGQWAVEGEGIAPDIEVIQDPVQTIKGQDPQLEAGVREALKLLETEEFQWQQEPEPPVRWKRPEGFEIKEEASTVHLD
ncbi:MAG: PDZ domain-containing protein [Flavobacteriaceae bacterium]|nr:PDZ domain-containing protein [Flavobacteriaceae bacterium]MCY4216256.1 PDZ domain-containing protein [Flavobacteriaceae bacterium]MCY4253129.1 PDZ domain-containing protein [Flavobacteriaceae bacterium]